jgi:hypothetical protein
MFIGLALGAQNPLGYNDGNFPSTNYLIDPADNAWYQKGDSIYSIFKINDEYFASGVKWSKSKMGFAMAFANIHDMPVKTGFGADEQVYWGVCRKGLIYKLNLQNTYPGKYDTNAVFAITDEILIVHDNPYYSLNPIWPDITELRVKKPVTTKDLTMSQFMAYQPLMPKYHAGGLKPEIVEGDVTLKVNKYFNSCTLRFTKAAVEKGYIFLKIVATPLKNSTSDQVSKTYKIYWQ